MNRKTNLIILAGLAAAILAALIWSMFRIDAVTVKTELNYARYETYEALQNAADLVVVGKAFGSIKEAERVAGDTGTAMGDLQSITTFRVEKVLKGDENLREVRVLQDACYRENKVYRLEEYAPIVEKREYELFLQKTDLPGVFGILGVYQGKFNLDGTDNLEKEMELKDPVYGKIKGEILSMSLNK